MKADWFVFIHMKVILGDGWEDPEVHKDSQNMRISALKMGANIIQYVFTN